MTESTPRVVKFNIVAKVRTEFVRMRPLTAAPRKTPFMADVAKFKGVAAKENQRTALSKSARLSPCVPLSYKR